MAAMAGLLKLQLQMLLSILAPYIFYVSDATCPTGAPAACSAGGTASSLSLVQVKKRQGLMSVSHGGGLDESTHYDLEWHKFPPIQYSDRDAFKEIMEEHAASIVSKIANNVGMPENDVLTMLQASHKVRASDGTLMEGIDAEQLEHIEESSWPITIEVQIPQPKNEKKEVSVAEKPLVDSHSLKVRVVVLTTFQPESQPWIDNFGWTDLLTFPAGGCLPSQDLRWNASVEVLHCCIGGGAQRAAASVTALGLDARFDFSNSTWILAGIAGSDPASVPLASTNWAPVVVDGDFGVYFDPREPKFPVGWEDGWLPDGRPLLATPYGRPPTAVGRQNEMQGMPYNVFKLSSSLVSWAYALTQNASLPDSDVLRKARSAYANSSYSASNAPPRVVSLATLSTSRYWAGAMAMGWARQWTRYWTDGVQDFGTAAMEDTGVATALQQLARAGRTGGLDKVLLVVRGASDYAAPPEEFEGDLQAWFNSFPREAAVDAACGNVYLVGAQVVLALTNAGGLETLAM